MAGVAVTFTVMSEILMSPSAKTIKCGFRLSVRLGHLAYASPHVAGSQHELTSRFGKASMIETPLPLPLKVPRKL